MLTPKIVYQSENAVLWCGDCLEVLPTLAPGSVDAVVTDPPYGISHSSNHGASWANTTIAGDSTTDSRDSILAWCREQHMPWASFGTWKTPPPAGTRGTLVWDKGPAFGMGDLSFPWKGSWEMIYVGGPGWSGHRDEGVVRGHICVSWESKGRVHPHQKPASLIQYLLGKIAVAQTILDPFTGSGTTGVACINTGRKFIGIELDPKYCDIAARRIEQAERKSKEVLVQC